MRGILSALLLLTLTCQAQKHLILDSLVLEKVENNTNIIYSDGIERERPVLLNYRGKVKGDSTSVVALSFTPKDVIGFVANKHSNNTVGTHGVVKDSVPPFECAVAGEVGVTGIPYAIPTQTTKCVQWWWEVDYDLYLSQGTNTATFIQTIFHQVQTLYANDGIPIVLKTLFIWTTPDPYTSTTTSGNLSQFGAYRTTFDGDLAHLIGTKGSGGMAYINGLCSGNQLNKKAYSAIYTSYNDIPVYSWTVENIAHEEGHLLGSNHTHDCAWNGNFTKIDSCGDYAGYAGTGFYGCPKVPFPVSLPYGGGTIMSYCHDTPVGVNFSLGFGQQPRQRMIDRINAAPCLTVCDTVVIPPPLVPSTKIDSIKTSTVNKAQLTIYYSGGIAKFYWQRSTGSNILGTTSMSPYVKSLSANITYNIWMVKDGVTSSKLTITTGTGATYK